MTSVKLRTHNTGSSLSPQQRLDAISRNLSLFTVSCCSRKLLTITSWLVSSANLKFSLEFSGFCEVDPEILKYVLAYFLGLVSVRLRFMGLCFLTWEALKIFPNLVVSKFPGYDKPSVLELSKIITTGLCKV